MRAIFKGLTKLDDKTCGMLKQSTHYDRLNI